MGTERTTMRMSDMSAFGTTVRMSDVAPFTTAIFIKCNMAALGTTMRISNMVTEISLTRLVDYGKNHQIQIILPIIVIKVSKTA